MTSATNLLAGRRVLVVEDDYFLAADMQREFEESGAEVLGPVPRVEKALQLIAATSRINAAVLDVNLLDEMVYPVADALQERGVPFVFATGYDRTVIPTRYAGVHHCEKPIEAAQIAEALFA
jgi:ActR/RegA family two-component response regulator